MFGGESDLKTSSSSSNGQRETKVGDRRYEVRHW